MLTELNWRRLQVLGLLVAGKITGGECIKVISPALNSALHTSSSSFNKGCLSNYKGEISVYGNKSSSKSVPSIMNRIVPIAHLETCNSSLTRGCVPYHTEEIDDFVSQV